ncbi:hypothetical protein [Dysgonomonas sp. Marseille-P4361]|uniref:hypothetical protein n=1 Tax=Dysgonomonas sp. Marseille-P4361 TaxID=2161820 RepID=UPI000D556FBC|nr:hypothetical protein [Dysgonomonas sp. Marseille-P4361]
MQKLQRVFLTLFVVFSCACGSKDEGAKLHLEAARNFYQQGKFDLAKQEIDSINLLYTKAIEERKASLALLDSVRRGENDYTIEICDSLITLYTPEVEKYKKDFVFLQNKEYQETGTFVPKTIASGGAITGTTLRSGVGEDGVLYLESVFVGGQKHNQIKVSAKDGTFVQSLPVTDEGLLYRFSNMGKSYEVIRFQGAHENGIAKFIYANKDNPLTIALEGKNKYTYTLSQTLKSAVSKSYQLSVMMLQLDSLKTEKEKAEFKNYNLDKKYGAVEEQL